MRRTLLTVLLAIPVVAGAAGQVPGGRWEGRAEIPGNGLPLVVDLAQDATGAWAGSIIVPGLGIKGAPLTNIVVTDTEVAFDLVTALGAPPYGPATFRAKWSNVDGMAGEMRQGGNAASYSLRKVGPAQVEATVRSTPVTRELAARWSGEFELGGYPRQVTITLENHADSGATAKFVIVGKRVNDLPVDLVVQDGNLLRIESPVNQIAFEGRIGKDTDEIRGTLEMGPLELPLTLRRAAGSAP
jgi:hypothetical protein